MGGEGEDVEARSLFQRRVASWKERRRRVKLEWPFRVMLEAIRTAIRYPNTPWKDSK